MLVARDGTERVLGKIAPGRTDLALVDALARLQLGAARRGGRLRLDAAPPELRELLDLLGLGGVLGLEPGGEPERLEVLGPDEVVQRGDPAA